MSDLGNCSGRSGWKPQLKAQNIKRSSKLERLCVCCSLSAHHATPLISCRMIVCHISSDMEEEDELENKMLSCVSSILFLRLIKATLFSLQTLYRSASLTSHWKFPSVTQSLVATVNNQNSGESVILTQQMDSNESFTLSLSWRTSH